MTFTTRSSAIAVPVGLLAIFLVFSWASSKALPAASPSLSAGPPAEVGFSAERLSRIDQVMQRAVDEETMAGAVTLVARHGRIVQNKAYGMADRENNVPMKTDAMFRMASTTKIVTTIAALQLLEEGRLLINDPISKYIPQFAKTSVAVPVPGSTTEYKVVPANRPLTIHDVLTKTTGISYPSGPTRALYEAQGFHQWYFADKTEPMCSMMEKLPQLPFHYQPGERWMNGYTADILGCVIEKLSGMTLDDYMRTRIFEPLRMHDTSFFVPKEKAPRLAAVYTPGTNGRARRADGRWNEGQGDYVDGPRVAFSGGAGLVSTAGDYARFLQALLNGGELDGARIISRKSIDLMTANHTGALYKNGTMGFGFNVEVTLEQGASERLGSVGDYGWQGAYFPRFLVDPSEDMFMIFLAQLVPYGGSSTLHDKFINSVYQALAPSARERTAASSN